jgi:hypothetical protein
MKASARLVDLPVMGRWNRFKIFLLALASHPFNEPSIWISAHSWRV